MNFLRIASPEKIDTSLLIFEAYLRQHLLCEQLRRTQWLAKKDKKAAKALKEVLDGNAGEVSDRLTLGMMMVIDRFPSCSMKRWRESLSRSMEMERDHCEPLFRIAYELHRIQAIYAKLSEAEGNAFFADQYAEQSASFANALCHFENGIREWMISDLNHGIPIGEVIEKSEEHWTELWNKLMMQASAALGSSSDTGKGDGGFHPLETINNAFHFFTDAKSA